MRKHWSFDLNHLNSVVEPLCREGTEMQMLRTDLWTQRGRESVRDGELVRSCWTQWEPSLVPVMTHSGWGEEVGSRRKGNVYNYDWFPLCMAETNTTLPKILN